VVFTKDAIAQNRASCPKFYLGLSTGLENPVGLLGFNFDVPVSSQLSLGGGAGLGSWGYKMAGEGRFYFDECHKGFAVGIGGTYATGLNDVPTEVEVNNGITITKQEVNLDLKPCANVFLSAYHFWELGRNSNRFYIQAGYSHRITNDFYDIDYPGFVLNDGSERVMRVLAPGGLMIGLGFSFALVR
jgi:hypothetical protein